MKYPILIIIIPGLLYAGLSIAMGTAWPIAAFVFGLGIGFLIDKLLTLKYRK